MREADRKRAKHQVEIAAVEPVMVSVEDAGRLLAMSTSETYEMIARGIVPAVRFSSRNTRVPLDALRQRMNELAVVGLTPVEALLAARAIQTEPAIRGRVV
ncbi:hypothetical protein [Symbiobacterium terraclitae]|uniref:hypothetical protein n=1 Tax=Symbiobacterium terraclitae TaxID=557451 RepID=UPI0035B55601